MWWFQYCCLVDPFLNLWIMIRYCGWLRDLAPIFGWYFNPSKIYRGMFTNQPSTVNSPGDHWIDRWPVHSGWILEVSNVRFEDYDLDPLDIGGGVAWPAGLLALNFFDVGFTNNNGNESYIYILACYSMLMGVWWDIWKNIQELK